MKLIKYYVAAFALALGVFNLTVFLVPETANAGKFTAAFWAGYAAITLAFLLHFIATVLALRMAGGEKQLHALSLIRPSLITLLVMLVLGGCFMTIPTLPYWGGIILCSAVLAVELCVMLRTLGAMQGAAAVGSKVNAATLCMRELTLLSLSLATTAPEDLRDVTRRVHEAIRYSDPVEAPALAALHIELRDAFAAFSDAVEEGDEELAEASAGDFLARLALRNEKTRTTGK